jgi:hypothetical protein
MVALLRMALGRIVAPLEVTTQPTADIGPTAAHPEVSGASSFFLFAFAVYFAVFIVMKPSLTPDELYYVLAAESLIRDRDLALANDYSSETLTHFGAPDVVKAAPDVYLARGEMLTFPVTGMALLLAPALYATRSLIVLRVEMIVLAALLAQQLWLLLAHLLLARRRWIALAWTAALFCPPLLLYSAQLLPELPAALLVIVALRMLLRPNPSPRHLIIAGATAALLPWLHVRFLVVAVGVLAGVAYHTLRQRGRAGRTPQSWCWPFVPGLVSIAGLMLAAWLTYGRWPFTWAVSVDSTWDLATVYRYAIGALLSPAYGWLPFAPIHWLGMAGLVPLVWRYRGVTAAILLAIAAYLLVIGRPYDTSASLPGRYLVVLAPLITVPLAAALARNRTIQWAGVILLAASLGMGGFAVTHARGLYPDISGRVYVAPFATLQELYPLIPGRTPGFKMTAAEAPHIIGRLDLARGALLAAPGADSPGVLAYGPHRSLSEGVYIARFTLAAEPVDLTRPVAILDIMQEPEGVIARREVLASELPASGEYSEHVLPFRTGGGRALQARVQWLGNGPLRFKEAEVSLLPGRSRQEQQFPYWPRVLFWLTAVLLVGGFLVLDEEQDISQIPRD